MVRTVGSVYAGFPVGECVLVLGSVLLTGGMVVEGRLVGSFCLTGGMVSGRVAVVVVVLE
jgi:hypothetical protein